MSISVHEIPCIAEHVASRLIGGEVFLMHLVSLKTFALNETASFIWSCVDGKRTVADIIDTIAEEYEVASGECRNSVIDFFDTLASQGIISPAGRND
jgi:hypothetical protein